MRSLLNLRTEVVLTLMKRSNYEIVTVHDEWIASKILLIRNHKVMLDRDLATLYGVKPIALRQQVKRNQERFPDDFMFQLSKHESEILVSQNVIPSKRSLGGFLPYVFTEQGVAMLSTVLKSKRAIQVNIAIMRTFVRLRKMLASHEELACKLQELEKKYDARLKVVFGAIHQLMALEPEPENQIGFMKSKNKKDLTGVRVRFSTDEDLT